MNDTNNNEQFMNNLNAMMNNNIQNSNETPVQNNNNLNMINNNPQNNNARFNLGLSNTNNNFNNMNSNNSNPQSNNYNVEPQNNKQNQFFNDETKTSEKPLKSNEEKNKKVKLIRYNYKVKQGNGEIITSYFDAEKVVDVEAFLLSKNYEILEIKEDKLSTALGLPKASSSRKMNSKDLNFFLTQLSTYVKSGIPLVDSMEIMSRQTKKSDLKSLYRKIVFELNRGTTFSACLEKQGKTFPKMLINMLKTSEMTGDLTGVLDDMARYYKQQDTNRKQIINAMTYPSVLMIFAVTILVFVMTYVVPSFTDMYKEAGQDLPGMTKAIISISDFLTNYWYFIALLLVLVIAIIAMLYKYSKGPRYGMQWLLMHIPVVKNMIIYNQLVTFTGTFATLIKHDVFITDSMDILGKITENEIYKGIIKSAINNLGKGNGVSIAFKGQWAFPETAYEMLVTGEKTGKLGEMLQHVTDYYQEEQSGLVTRLKSLIEPVMIILLALIVGVVLLSVILPMFNLYGGIV